MRLSASRASPARPASTRSTSASSWPGSVMPSRSRAVASSIRPSVSGTSWSSNPTASRIERQRLAVDLDALRPRDVGEAPDDLLFGEAPEDELEAPAQHGERNLVRL